MYHITFLPYCKYSASFPFTCNKTQASPNGLPSPVWSGPCLLLSDLVFFHTPLFTGLQHHWFSGSPNTWASSYLRAGTLPLLSACSGLLLDIAWLSLIIQVSAHAASTDRDSLAICLRLPPQPPISSLSENDRTHLLVYLFIIIVCFPLKEKSIRKVRTFFSLLSSCCFPSLPNQILSFLSPLWFLLIIFIISIFTYLPITPTSPI